MWLTTGRPSKLTHRMEEETSARTLCGRTFVPNGLDKNGTYKAGWSPLHQADTWDDVALPCPTCIAEP